MSSDEDEEEEYVTHGYESSSVEEVEANEEGHKGRRTVIWRPSQNFISKEEAQLLLDSEGCWATGVSYDTAAGRKQHYRCNKVPIRGPQCAMAIYLLFNAESDAVSLFASALEHTHEDVLAQPGKAPAAGINKATKAFIAPLIRQKAAPKTIRMFLATELAANTALRMPTVRQLYNFCAALKKKEDGGPQMNFDELSQWCAKMQPKDDGNLLLMEISLSMLSLQRCVANCDVPGVDEPNKAFTVSYQINIDGDDQENFPEIGCFANPVASMRLFISTRHLLSLASQHLRVLQVDATYKLLWLGFPVLVIGISDSNRVNRSEK
jgi:hypothetical protein